MAYRARHQSRRRRKRKGRPSNIFKTSRRRNR